MLDRPQKLEKNAVPFCISRKETTDIEISCRRGEQEQILGHTLCWGKEHILCVAGDGAREGPRRRHLFYSFFVVSSLETEEEVDLRYDS